MLNRLSYLTKIGVRVVCGATPSPQHIKNSDTNRTVVPKKSYNRLQREGLLRKALHALYTSDCLKKRTFSCKLLFVSVKKKMCTLTKITQCFSIYNLFKRRSGFSEMARHVKVPWPSLTAQDPWQPDWGKHSDLSFDLYTQAMARTHARTQITECFR